MDISEVINELNKRIKEKYSDFKGSYLYGSRAKGNYKNTSDIDIVALFDEVTSEKEFDICRIIGRLEYKYNVFIEFQPYTLSELKMNSVYYNEVVGKGIFYEPA